MLQPSQLEEDGSSAWQRIDVLSIRVYRDAAYAKRDPRGPLQIAELIDRANQTLQARLHLKLELESVRELPEQIAQKAGDLDALLDSLPQLDPAKDVALVLALVGQNPIMTFSFHELGRAQWLGQYMAMRSIDDVEEMRLFAENLNTLGTEARTRLYAERKRHKETAVLLHELGHALGALHVSEESDLMNPTYHHTATTFANENVVLMRYGLAERLQGEDDRDFTALAQHVQAYLSKSSWPGWFEGERDEHLEVLKRSLEQATAAQQAAALAAQQHPKAQPAAPVDDLTGLSEQDCDKFREIDQARGEHDAQRSFRLATELADQYRDSLSVQRKACELGMVFRVEPRFFIAYCARMSELQKP